MRDENQRARDAFMSFSIKFGAAVALVIAAACLIRLITR
jgi:hypothetical protein